MNDKIKIIKNSILLNNMGGMFNLIRISGDLFFEPLRSASSPLFIQIEPTVACNLACKMCASPFAKREPSHLDLNRFEIIAGQFPYLRKLSLVGVGEPLLNPDLFKIIKCAKSRNILVGFTTNGTLLDSIAIENILESMPDWLNISVDGATRETYEKIRKGASFDLVINNIKELMKAKKKSKINISLWFTGMQDNINELPQMVKLTSELGIKELDMQTVHFWGKEEWKERLDTQRLKGALSKLKHVILEAKDSAIKHNIRFRYVNTPSDKAKRTCQWPWKACYITVDGFVTPCCIHGSDPDVLNFGNIFESPFVEIWNSEGYQAFRNKLKSGTPPDICNGCTSYYEKIELKDR